MSIRANRFNNFRSLMLFGAAVLAMSIAVLGAAPRIADADDPPRTGRLDIIQDTVLDGPQDFQYSFEGVGFSFNFPLDDDTDPPWSNQRYFTNRPPGQFSIEQTPVFGYSLSISCIDPDGGTTTSGNTVAVDWDADEDIECTFINTRQGGFGMPLIEITKTPAVQTVNPGETATFDIAIANSGDTLLSNIVVTDPNSPDCDRTFEGILENGPPITYSCERTNVLADFINVATVTADTFVGPETSSDTSEQAVVTVQTTTTSTSTTTSTTMPATTTTVPLIATPATPTTVVPLASSTTTTSTTTSAPVGTSTVPNTPPADTPSSAPGVPVDGTILSNDGGVAGSNLSRGGSATLPRTGHSVLGLALSGVALLLSGIWMLRRSRTRRLHL